MKNIKIKIGNMVWYPLKTLQAFGMIISVFCIVWFGVSLIEIWCNNLNTEPVYSIWNYFNFLAK